MRQVRFVLFSKLLNGLNMKKIIAHGALLTTLALSAISASASLITTAPASGVTTTFSGSADCTSGTTNTVVSGFNVYANGDSCLGYSGGFGLGKNGSWNISLLGDNNGSTKIRIDLGGLYSSVGGFMNMAPGYGTPIISAIASDGVTVLESYDLTHFSFPSGADVGAFAGIDTGANNIRFFDFGGSYIVMHNINLNSANHVPEPATLGFLGLALLSFAATRRRK